MRSGLPAASEFLLMLWLHGLLHLQGDGFVTAMHGGGEDQEGPRKKLAVSY
jgi:hypothetical protein